MMIIERVIFNQVGLFEAMLAAEDWLRERDYSVGSSCYGCPRGVLKGDFPIAKWRNLTKEEIDALDGRMLGDMRHGPVTIEIFAPARNSR